MKNIKNTLETLVPKILNLAHKKGVQKMEALLNACVQEEGLDEEAKLSDEEKIVVGITCLPSLLEKPTKKNPCPENYFYQVFLF